MVVRACRQLRWRPNTLISRVQRQDGRRLALQCHSTFSKRRLAELEEELKQELSTLQDPVVQRSLLSMGWAPKRLVASNDTNCDLELQMMVPSPLHPHWDTLETEIRTAASKVVGGASLKIAWQPTPCYPVGHTVSQQEYDDYIQSLGPGLANVRHCIAVYSGKGGVGKSTLAVNLAMELARVGQGRVGLLDVDVYGPSLPVLVRPDSVAVKQSSRGRGMVHPIDYEERVKLLSLGFVSPNSGVPGSDGGAAVMRGPLAARVVTQLLKGTEWGDLDVLVLDLPPGTGDVPLAVCQELQLSGSIVVTTPSKLAKADATKGVDMMTSLGVPTLAVVQNMSYFVCEGQTKHYPFGRLQQEEEEALYDCPVFEWPISTTTNACNDEGIPLAVSRPPEAHEELRVLQNLANSVAEDLLRIAYSASATAQGHPTDPESSSSSQQQQQQQRLLTHKVVFPQHRGDEVFDIASSHLSLQPDGTMLLRFFSEQGGLQMELDPEQLRGRDPKTGEPIEDRGTVVVVEKSNSNTLKNKPHQVERKGRYGYAVHWSDGSTFIYSMLSLAKASGGVENEAKNDANESVQT